VAVKVVALGGVWLVVPPLLIGVLFELICSAPFRTPHNETPRYPVVHCWAIGLVFLKLWVRLVLMLEEGNVWHRRFQRVFSRGLAGIDARYITVEIIVPAVLFLLDFLLTPFFVARVAGLFVSSYAVQTALVRHSFALYAALRVSAVATDKVCTYVASLYNEIRDSRYLVGTELTNLTVRPAEPRSPASPASGNN